MLVHCSYISLADEALHKMPPGSNAMPHKRQPDRRHVKNFGGITVVTTLYNQPKMSPAVLLDHTAGTGDPASDPTVNALRKTITDEQAPLAKRFRALFSLKHLASQEPPTQQTLPAIEAIAAAFASPSALLKHELAYCLGQSGKLDAVPFLRAVLEDYGEDAMVRHESAEALGAIGDQDSLQLLKERRDDPKEGEVVRETCVIAVDRIEWEHSEAGKAEKLKQR